LRAGDAKPMYVRRGSFAGLSTGPVGCASTHEFRAEACSRMARDDGPGRVSVGRRGGRA